MFIAVLFIIAKKTPNKQKPSKYQTDKWINAMWYICKMEYYVATEKE